MTNGARAVVEVLKREGVEYVFSLPGTTVLDIYDVLAGEKDIRLIVTRHEQGAAHMADGYARISGKVGVCLASRGPGAANMASAIHEAYVESIPMVVLIGAVSDSIYYRDAFEEMDLISFFRPMTKACFEIHSPERIPELLQRALRTARSGRPRPVLVSLPHDVLKAETMIRLQATTNIPKPGPAGRELDEALGMLLGSKRPGIYLGGGVVSSEASGAIKKLAARLNIPVVVSWGRKDAFPNTSPNYLGMLGSTATASTRSVLSEADVLLAVGTRFSEFSTFRWTGIKENTKLIHIDIDPEELGKLYVPTLGIVADAGEAIRQMAEALPKIENTAHQKERTLRCRSLRQAYLTEVRLPEGNEGPGYVSSPAVVRSLQEILQPRDVVAINAVTFEGWFLKYYNSFVEPRTFHFPAGGTLGWGLPAAMGLYCGAPERRVVAILGDAALLMNIQEFETIVRENIPLKIIVMNNNCYGNIRERQMVEFGGRLVGSLYENPNFSDLAGLFGIPGERVSSAAALPVALRKALEREGPALVEIIQAREEGLPPGITPQVAK